jgi:hypothetical protein
MKMLWVVGAVLIVIVALVLAAGFLLPRQSSAMRSAFIPAPPDRVFALVTEVGAQAAWRRDVASVEVSSDGKSWTEKTRDGATIEFTETGREADRSFSLSFRSSQGISGTWTGRFEAAGDGTAVSFVETVDVPNPVFRLLGRLFDFTGKHMDAYVDDLRQAATKRAGRR